MGQNHQAALEDQEYGAQGEEEVELDNIAINEQIERHHEAQTFKRQVPLQRQLFATPQSFNTNLRPQVKFQEPLFSGVDERSHKIRQLRHSIYNEVPKSIEKGKGDYNFNLHEFSKVLISYVFKERELENAKVSLIKKSDFNLMDFFKLLDWRNQGSLSPSDILQSLKAYLNFSEDFSNWDSQTEVNSRQQHLFYLLYRRYDTNLDSLLDFPEFCNMILPRNQELAALLANRPDYYMHRSDVPLDQYFNLDTRFEMCKLMELLLNNEYEFERLRNQLQAMTYFSLKEVYQHMDYDMKGYLVQEDF
jgi:hypothetical protein